MTSCWRRLVALALLLTLFAAACSSSDSSDPVASGDGTADEPTTQETPDAEPTAVDDIGDPPEPTPEPTPIPQPTAAPAEPADVFIDLARNIFNIDPDEAAIKCMVDEAAASPGMTDGLSSNVQLLPEELERVTFVMNGCIASDNFAAWATEAVGPRGPVRDTAPGCFEERFSDPETGDVEFYGFVAVTLRSPLDPAALPAVIDTLSACAPVSSLGDFFAAQREADEDFAIEIDRDCLTAALTADGLSQEFWRTLIAGDPPVITVVSDQLDSCSQPYGESFLQQIPEDFVAWSGAGQLSNVLPRLRTAAYDAPPPMSIDATKSYQAVITTGGSEIRIELFADTAPITVNNFVSLARDGYYDQTTFHRVLDDFMAQAGDPTGLGTGGPGYQFGDEFDGGPEFDRAGLLAMANAGPATNGSQFFITFVPTPNLNGRHTIFGEVIEGADIVNAIERRNPDAPTNRGQLIESIVIIEN